MSARWNAGTTTARHESELLAAVDSKERAIKDGKLTLRRCGILNTLKGRTSLEEILRVTVGD